MPPKLEIPRSAEPAPSNPVPLPTKLEVQLTPAPPVEAVQLSEDPTQQQKPAPAPPPIADLVKQRILALAVEKTGYPSDMLDLDLDLEADLGVDTVKQAEMFAAIREIYNIPRDEARKLRDYPTLAHVIRFVYEQRPDLAAPTPVVAAVATAAPAPSGVETPKAVPSAPLAPEVLAPAPQVCAEDPVKERILALAVEKTGYPKDMLDLDLDLEADLGVDTVKQAEMFAAIREIYNIPRDESRKLRDYPTLAHVIRFVYERRPDLSTAASVTVSLPVEPGIVDTPAAVVATAPKTPAANS